jgi:ADP-heptose:LPS heptosyltransferase
MFTCWHVSAPEEHLLARWLRGALEEAHQGWRYETDDLLSWDSPGGDRVRWVRFPDLREGDAASLADLRRDAVPDLAVTLHPEVWGATLETGGHRTPIAWLGTEQHEARIPLVGASRGWLAIRSHRIAFVGGRSLAADWQRAQRLAAAAVQAFPDAAPELYLDRHALSRAWGQPGNEAPAPVQIEPGDAEILVLLEGGIEWAPLLPEAAERGRLIAAPADAEYAGLLPHLNALAWDGAWESLQNWLVHLRSDPAAAEAYRRKGRAWSRRWTRQRSLGQLRNAAFGPGVQAFGHSGIQEAADGGPGDQAVCRPRRWTLRREVGIGDVVFTLVVGAELKRRDPACRLTIHTAPEHAEWVSWFPFVDRVTSGPFEPDPAETVGDFERFFPHSSQKDRCLALGEQIGVRPREWLPPPILPPDLQRWAGDLLANTPRPRIALVPVAQGRSPARSLPDGAPQTLARDLSRLGSVVWIEAHEAAGVPDGVVNLSGRGSIPEALAALGECDLVISVDSGLLYAGAALGKPVVGIFTHIGALQRLWLAHRFIALEPALPCAPCGEAEGALHCRRAADTAEQPFRLACAQLDVGSSVAAAVERLLCNPGPGVRDVWRVGPLADRVELAVERIPAPWPV